LHSSEDDSFLYNRPILKHIVFVLTAMALGGLLLPGDDQRADAWTIRQPNK
jgi:hypothetical protein